MKTYLIPFVFATAVAHASATTVWVDKTGHLYWSKGTAQEDILVKKTRHALAKRLRAPLPLEEALAGAIGGNEKSGLIYYDGGIGNNHRPALKILRNPLLKQCYLQNNQVEIRNWKTNLEVVSFPCAEKNAAGIYWQKNLDVVNGAYNPAWDAFYYADAFSQFLERTTARPAWQAYTTGKKPIIILLHGKSNFFDFGGFFSDGSNPWFVNLDDGDAKNFPSTTLDALSNLISAGNALSNWGYSWGDGNSPSIAQSYSDFLTKSFEYDLTGKVTWSMGADTTKWETAVWRYLDKPSRDCIASITTPGISCSIETYAQFKAQPFPPSRYGSGLLNKVLYTIATSPNWDIPSTLTLLNRATYYWGIGDWIFDPTDDTPPSDHFNFRDVLCNLVTAARDLNSDQAQIDGVIDAVKQTGLDMSTCPVNKN